MISYFAAFLAFSMLAAASMLYKNHCGRLANLRSQQRSIELTARLKQLLTQAQQHRGMVSGYLNGDQSFKYKIPALQAEIARNSDTLAELLAEFSEHASAFGRIRQSWQDLQNNACSSGKEYSFERHCIVIADILKLLQDIAEQAHLHRDSSCPYSFTETIWHLLPDVAEAIGQARAIGVGIAATGRSKTTERIKLGFLVKRIRQALKRAETGIFASKTYLSADGEFQPVSVKLHTNIQHLLETVEKQFIGDAISNIDPGHYFETATSTISAVFSLYDRGEQLALRVIHQELTQARRHQWLSLSAACLSLIGAVAALLAD
ncbi:MULTISPECIES: nitrate- and nitrite sensing domain-containing protein [Methylomonas]|uniref:nitrate- and nitrite sensing domain-containing protein n=1 Tax=Methylomonas TaxID=416 RepID=UPI001231B568|nr:nitrate- and nitrite sensing domain-containing protein [Methylomonas rhizoryzae]